MKSPGSVPLESECRGSVSNGLLSGGGLCPCYHLSKAFSLPQCPCNVVHLNGGYDCQSAWLLTIEHPSYRKNANAHRFWFLTLFSFAYTMHITRAF